MLTCEEKGGGGGGGGGWDNYLTENAPVQTLINIHWKKAFVPNVCVNVLPKPFNLTLSKLFTCSGVIACINVCGKMHSYRRFLLS